MQAANRVIKNTGILYAKMGITMFISLYTTRLILNSLGVTDFGIFNIVGGAIAMLGFLNASMASATQRFMSFAEGEGNNEKQIKIFNVSLILHFFISIIVGIVLLVLGFLFFSGILNIPMERIHAAQMVYYFMILSTMFTIMTVPYDAVLNAHENMLYYSIVGIVESLLKLTVAIIIVNTNSDKLILYGLLMACVSFFIMLIMRVYCNKKYTECQFNPKSFYDKSLMKEMTNFAGWSLMTTAVTMISNYGLGIVLNIFFGTLLNAAQGIANQISGQLSLFSNNMMKALAPVIVKTEGAGNRSNMLKAASFGGKTGFMLSMIFMAPFIVEAPYILHIWLKNVPDYAVVFSRLVLLQVLFESFLNSLSQSIMAEGNIGKATIVRTIHNIIYLPIICVVFYFKYDAQYMYYLMLFKTIVAILIVLYFNKVNCGLKISHYIKEVLFPCTMTLIIIIGVLLFVKNGFSESLIRVLSNCAISFFITILAYYYIILNQEEKNMAKEVIIQLSFKLKRK
jgi:O-antigen/teichoic acid export membrane protein